ncbi:MAG: 5'/3'-nucleotidase SurE [Desulfobulbaceae bacterium]|nr:MAG: 5'/3'-nucleotidase SurE [Desulfobulbaceae bacterium]
MTKIILITNDDGIHSSGLAALKSALTPLGRVITVAPDRDNSAISHALTMDRPLRIQQVETDTYCVNGTPTDCVALGLNKILEAKPDLLVSGINLGPNLGDDISYSGTVSAAIEGTMYSIPSMAVSAAGREPYDFARAEKIIRTLSLKVMDYGLPANTLMNINVPNIAHLEGIKVTRQGRRLWKQPVQEIADPRGRTFYWIGGGTPLLDGGRGTDVEAINNNYISVTPIHLDLTNHEGISFFKEDLGIEDLENI